MRKFRMYLVRTHCIKRSASFPGEYSLEQVNENLNNPLVSGLDYEIREVFETEKVVEIKTTTVVKREIV